MRVVVAVRGVASGAMWIVTVVLGAETLCAMTGWTPTGKIIVIAAGDYFQTSVGLAQILSCCVDRSF